MDIIGQIINYLNDFAQKSESYYHVNPWIFCILFFGSALPLYYGYYRIGRSFIKYENKRFSRKELNNRELKIGLTFSIAAWWLPYVYVIMFGRLPWYMWLFFAAFILIIGVSFVKTLRKKVAKAKNNADE